MDAAEAEAAAVLLPQEEESGLLVPLEAGPADAAEAEAAVLLPQEEESGLLVSLEAGPVDAAEAEAAGGQMRFGPWARPCRTGGTCRTRESRGQE